MSGVGLHHQVQLSVHTAGQGLYEITHQVAKGVADSSINVGLCTVFVRHTSCSLIIQENADPDVQVDLKAFFSRLVPSADDASMSYLVHRMEGPDDMPAHIKAALTQTSIGIPIQVGELMLGRWQGIYLFEHRDAPHLRDIVVHVSGSTT